MLDINPVCRIKNVVLLEYHGQKIGCYSRHSKDKSGKAMGSPLHTRFTITASHPGYSTYISSAASEW